MRNSHLGIKLSEERRKNISEGHKGLIRSKEHCENLSKSLTGKPLTEIHKKNVSIGTKKGMNNPLIRQKLRNHRATQIFPLKDSSIEIKIQNYLKQLNIDFFTHQYMNITHGYQCDIFIPSLNLVVECDGIYWHHYPTGRDIDHIRTKELLDKGFKVLRLWEFEIRDISLTEFELRLKNNATNI
jgi:very-short-patch-repair endonuclease